MGIGNAGALAVLAFLASVPTPALGQGRVVVGEVRSRLDSVPLDGVLLRIRDSGVSGRTNSLGIFRLVGVPDATFDLTVLRSGFVPETLTVRTDQSTLVVYLAAVPVQLRAVVVDPIPDALDRFLNEAQTSRVTLGVAEIERTPGLLESDVLRSVQLLPGTVSKNDYSVGFNVRGGESDQNLVLLDGVTVFNPSHLGGLFSTFDATAIEDVRFLTGGFPASYDGRLSSVVDIGVRPGNHQRTAIRGQLSLLSSKVLVEGPLGRGSFLAGVRRTYADAVVNTFSSATLPYYFADVVGKLNFPVGARSSLAVTGYWGRDNLNLELVAPRGADSGVDLAFDWGNRLLGFNSTHAIGDATVQNHLSLSEFSTTLGLLPGILRYDNSARLVTVRSLLSYHPRPEEDRTVGLALQSYRMDFMLGSPDVDVTFADQGYRPAVASAFVDEVWRPDNRVWLSSGLRVDHGLRGATFTRLSPRGSVKVFFGSRTAVTASAGRYHQVVHSLRDQEQPVTIFEFWVGADSVVPVARADHFVLGLENWFGAGHSLTVEAYRKNYRDLLTVNRLQDLNVIGDEFVRTTGRSDGVDIMFKRYTGRYRGWMSYGYSRSRRVTPTDSFPPAHDRRHTLNVVMTGPGPLGSEMGVRWGLGSPLPFTGIEGEFNHREYSPLANNWVDEEREPIGSGLNRERYPAYSRLDFSFRWSVQKWGGVLRPYLNIVNVFNRQNVFLYFFDFSQSPVTRTGVSQLPLLPTFGVEFEW